MSMKTQIMATVGTFTVVAMIALSLIFYFNTREAIMSQVEARLTAQAEELASMITTAYQISESSEASDSTSTPDAAMQRSMEMLKDDLAEIVIGETGYVFIMNSEADYILSKDRQRDGENLWEAKDADGELFVQEMIKNTTANNTYIRYYPWSADGKSKPRMKVAAATYIPELDWYVCPGSFYEEFLGELAQMRTLSIWIILIAVGLSFVIILYVSSRLAKPIRDLQETAERLASGDMSVDLNTDYKDEVAGLVNSMSGMASNIRKVINEFETVSTAATEGNLGVRANAEQFKGDFKKITVGFNETLDAIISPLNMTAEYIDRISKGDMPPMITEDYRGDFNEIKTNVNQCIEAISLLVKDSDEMAQALVEGNLDKRADTMMHQGDFQKIIEGLNTAVDNVAAPFNIAVDFLNDAAAGNNMASIDTPFNGKYEEMRISVNTLREKLYTLSETMQRQSEATINGRLDVRANVEDMEGNWAVIFDNFNSSLDALINPLNMMAEYVDRISKGDIPEIIVDEYKGDFNEIKLNLNTCIDSINGMLGDVNTLISAASREEYDTRADASVHSGDYKKIVAGINELFDTIVDKIFWFEQLVDAIPFPMSVTDMDMNWTLVNKAASEVMGRDKKEAIGKQCENWGADICGTDRCGIECLRKGQPTSYFTQPGLDRDFKVDTSYLTDSKGERIGHVEIVQDVSAEKRSAAYDKVEIERLSNNLRLIATGDLDIDKEITPENEFTAENYANFKSIYDSLEELIDSVSEMLTDTLQIVDRATEGELNHRADETKHTGEFKKIITGLNNTLDAVVEPITEAGNILGIMADGDLTQRMQGNYKGQLEKFKDDINLLAESLYRMISKVRASVADTAEGAKNISSSSETIAAASQEMNSQADDVASAVEEMARTVTENAQGATNTSEMAQQNADIATQGGRVVQDTVQKMNDISRVVEETARSIEKLGESSKAIGDIVSVIDDIADQTNLLALNASIEAARAGEQGRGFAVVADEVRKLAEKTVDATKEIADQIKAIQQETADAVEAMNQGTKEVESGIKLADEAGKALEKVLESSNEVTQMIADIAAASEQQAATTEEISKNVLGISQATGETTHQVEEVANVADQLAQLTVELNSLMDEFNVGNTNYYAPKQLRGD